MSEQIVILPAPRISPTVEGVFEALDACLVAVVNAGDAGQCVLQYRRGFEAQLRKRVIFLRKPVSPSLRLGIGSLHPRERGERAHGVVGAQESETHVHALFGIMLRDESHGVAELLSVPSHDEFEYGAAERIIHHAVQFLSHEIGAPGAVTDLVGRVLPHLADDESVLLCGTYLRAQQVCKIRGELVHHVQPPAVRAHGGPLVYDAALPRDEPAETLCALVHGGHHGGPPPAVVIVGMFIEGVPPVIGRVRPLIRPFPGEIPELIEVNAVRARMIEHAVQHHAHTLRFRRRAKPPDSLVAAEEVVRFHVVRGVVTVVAGREKDGGEIDGGHPQTFEVLQLRDDAVRVAAEEVVRAVLAALVRDVGQVVPVRVQPASLCETHLALPCETVGKDLIDHPGFRPIRGFIVAFRHGKLPFRQPFSCHGAAARSSSVIGRPAVRHALEAVVPQPCRGCGHAPRIDAVVPRKMREFKFGAELLRPTPQDDGHFVRALAGRQRKAKLRPFPCDGSAVRRLVPQRVVIHEPLP